MNNEKYLSGLNRHVNSQKSCCFCFGRTSPSNHASTKVQFAASEITISSLFNYLVSILYKCARAYSNVVIYFKFALQTCTKKA